MSDALCPHGRKPDQCLRCFEASEAGSRVKPQEGASAKGGVPSDFDRAQNAMLDAAMRAFAHTTDVILRGMGWWHPKPSITRLTEWPPREMGCGWLNRLFPDGSSGDAVREAWCFHCKRAHPFPEAYFTGVIPDPVATSPTESDEDDEADESDPWEDD